MIHKKKHFCGQPQKCFLMSGTRTESEDTMTKHTCDICGYVYDPANGDASNGIVQGTAFEALPDDWRCPDCGVGKDQFTKG
jgi:rubredoxin